MTVQVDQKKPHLFSANLLVWAVSLFFLVPNFLFTLQGFTTRYWADDYCFSGIIKEFGFFDGLAVFYFTISNRFSAFIFAGLSEIFGSIAIRVIPTAVIIAMGFSLYLVIKRIFDKGMVAGSKSKSFLLSQVLLFFILYLSPNIAQSVYWRSGLTHYFLPVPFMLILVAVIFSHFPHDKNIFLRAIGIFSLAVLNAGLSESYAALQFGLLSLLLFFAALHYKFNFHHDQIRMIVVALIGTDAAMLLMIISPGNAIRLDALQQASGIGPVVSIALSSAFDFIKFSIRGLWLPFGTLFGWSILFAFYFIRSASIKLKPTQFGLLFFGTFLAIFGLIVCVCAPTAYGMLAYPEQRVLMLAHFLLVVGVFIEGCIVGLFLQEFASQHKIFNLISMIFLFLLSLYPLSTIQTRLMEFKEYSARASLWDIRDAEIQTKIEVGEMNLVVSAIDSFSEIAELNADPKFWVNQCAAEYYGVESLSALERK